MFWFSLLRNYKTFALIWDCFMWFINVCNRARRNKFSYCSKIMSLFFYFSVWPIVVRILDLLFRLCICILEVEAFWWHLAQRWSCFVGWWWDEQAAHGACEEYACFRSQGWRHHSCWRWVVFIFWKCWYYVDLCVFVSSCHMYMLSLSTHECKHRNWPCCGATAYAAGGFSLSNARIILCNCRGEFSWTRELLHLASSCLQFSAQFYTLPPQFVFM